MTDKGVFAGSGWHSPKDPIANLIRCFAQWHHSGGRLIQSGRRDLSVLSRTSCNDAWRNTRSPVQLVNSTPAISSGFTQCSLRSDFRGIGRENGDAGISSCLKRGSSHLSSWRGLLETAASPRTTLV
jgi:hypothetical protein